MFRDAPLAFLGRELLTSRGLGAGLDDKRCRLANGRFDVFVGARAPRDQKARVQHETSARERA